MATLFNLNLDTLVAFGTENKLSLEVFDKMALYLKGSACIAKCLQSDAYISKPIREKILNELFMPMREEASQSD